jgi:anthranilate phosphoribosyltransferase
MEPNQEIKLSALQQGVKLIGIGKHGSKKIPENLVLEITQELITGKAEPLLAGAFIGAVMMKDPEPSYLSLENYFGKGSLKNPALIWENFCAEVPNELKPIGIKLLNKEELNTEEATLLGNFLFSTVAGDFFRGLAMSILRIRYESDDEYLGLYKSLQNNAGILPGSSPKNDSLIQLAEPFDGVEHSYMITPLLARAFQEKGYTVVATCSQNAGPKSGINTHDIYKALAADFVKKGMDLSPEKPLFGWAMDPCDYYPALTPWIDRRRILMKRPFLATLEKVLNPLNAKILITSVFHIPYLEKMVQLADMAGFDGVIVLKRGLEGSLAPSLAKASGIFCAARNKEGVMVTTSILPSSQNKIEADPVIEGLSVQQNIFLIQQYSTNGKSDNLEFNGYADLAILVYKEGLEWIDSILLLAI